MTPWTAAHQASLSIASSWRLLKLMSIESLMPSSHLIPCHPLLLLEVQGTLMSLLQHHSSKASILQCSAIFMVQLSHLYMAPGKIMALTTWTFIGKVLSLSLFFFFGLFFVSLLCLCFLIHSRFVIAFLPRSKCLLMSLLKSPSTVVLEPKKKICHCFHFFPHLVAMK